MKERRVVIVGGGLAGLAAGVRLAEHDCEVILIETRKKLGGRATSFVDPRSGEVLDNCQHVLMGCCTNLIDFYDRLGVLDAIEWHRNLYWTRPRKSDSAHEIDVMKAGRFPAPFHFTNSFRRMSIFTKAEKRAIARAMWRMIRMGRRGRFLWRDRTFAVFLNECEQPETIVRDFWNTIIVSACNLEVHRVSASSAIQVFQEGFLANKWSHTMGLATVPLWTLYEPAKTFIKERGGQVRLGESAKSIAYDGNRVTGVITEHEIINAGAVIAAVPFDRLDKLVSNTMRTVDQRLQNLDQLEVSPILGVHLFFDQQVMPDDLPHLVLVGEELNGVQWLFNKTGNEEVRSPAPDRLRGRGQSSEGGCQTPGDEALTSDLRPLTSEYQHVHAVISAADEWMPLDEQTIIRLVLEDIHRALPQSKGLTPIRARAVKEKRATFAPTPQSERYRPGVTPGTVGLKGGGIPNLYLAGDWVDTGWPATMEGAVRSGYAAAAAIAGEHPGAGLPGTVPGGIVEDVPPGRLAAILGLR